MDIAVMLLAFVALVMLKFYTSRSYSNQAVLHLPPGPWQLPLIGSLHHLLLSRFRDLPHRAMPKEILKIHDLSFCNRPISPTADIMSSGGQNIVHCPYNERWRELRKICMLELLNQRRVQQFRSVREDEVARLMRIISNECSSGQPINLSNKINCLVSDIIVRTAIGERSKHRDEFLRELDDVMRLGTGFSLVDLYPSSRLVRWLSTSTRDIERCRRNIDHIIENIIHERATKSTVERDDDLLSVLLRLQKDNATQFTLTNEIITAVILDIFGAGSDTASVTDTKYWDAAEEFQPERFNNRNIDFKGNNLEYIPFGAGRRICPGMTFGCASMELALASLLYHFDWDLPDDVNTNEFDMTEAFGISVKRKSKLLLHARPHIPSY
ncbi:hypothetical protein QOZ80_7BG0593890 [Eleusine coracana subsp. coracana]|nr:hypothetical protein QOZ80_7BG0593890 [Eleusine coracana subsp. coracana]